MENWLETITLNITTGAFAFGHSATYVPWSEAICDLVRASHRGIWKVSVLVSTSSGSDEFEFSRRFIADELLNEISQVLGFQCQRVARALRAEILIWEGDAENMMESASAYYYRKKEVLVEGWR